jgi:hydrogenase maturation protein HypF
MKEAAPERAKVVVHGAVQGVGFRPFVYRLATELGLKGWVSNSAQGVFIEVEGKGSEVRRFLLRAEKEKPPRAIVQSMEFSFLDAVGYESFEIRASEKTDAKTAFILPDIGTCADCLSDIFDPANRRHRYPFTNCTNCGPRFSIIEALPYDRENTSMRKFTMCADCEAEYHDPLDRRFHAQPNACARCGPQLKLWDAAGQEIAADGASLLQAAEKVRAGEIVAVKGIGGFHLIVDARNEAAVTRLRARKRREEKPFALLYPNLDSVRPDCFLSELEERLLASPESPIVLLRKRASKIAASVAPNNPWLGVMLPSNPIQHLLMRELGFPVVATSGNSSDEPICTNEHEAFERLNDIVEFFLVHNRPIVRPIDDSILQVVSGREMMLRRARGYAPLPIHLKKSIPSVLAVGAHLKNTVAVGLGTEVFLSQHIGDLATTQAHAAFRAVAGDLPRLYEMAPELVACDLHPDYLSTKYAAELNTPLRPVQHHWAHVLSCMAENEIETPALGVAWDGTGYGTDGTIWGGEFLLASEGSFERAAHLRPFRLPGGEAAMRQPRRSALGLLFALEGEKAFDRREFACLRDFSAAELALMRQMLAREFQTPVTTSAGRLFDAVASLIGLRQRASFEGQAAMELEFALQPGVEDLYPFRIVPGAPSIVDWQAMMEEILEDIKEDRAVGMIAAKFHNTLAEMIVAVAQKVNEKKVILSGGCFQNRYLIERTVRRLSDSGFQPYWHQRVPTNDGGIALGQVMGAVPRNQSSSARERKAGKSKPLASRKAGAMLRRSPVLPIQVFTT